MNKSLKLWIIPAVFFALCSIIHLYGDLACPPITKFTKAALMPLLALTTVAALADSPSYNKRRAILLLAGQLFGFAGDTMLLDKSFIFFAGGILLFLIGHIFYISLFAGISWKGMKPWQWVVGLASCLLLTVSLVIILKVSGSMLIPMGVYAFVLSLLMFSGLAGALRKGGGLWWLLFAGTVAFTFSDALIAVRTFSGLSQFMGDFMVMFTYILAQAILAFTGYKIVRGEIAGA